MSTLTTTLLIIFIVVVLGITAWAIRWLVTGKSRSIRRDGCCGKCHDKDGEEKH